METGPAKAKQNTITLQISSARESAIMARILSPSLYTWRCVALPTTTTHGNPENTLKITGGNDSLRKF